MSQLLNLFYRSDEMEPKWFKESNVPFDKMWDGDYIWYPLMFQKKFGFELVKYFSEDHSKLLYHELNL